tara:strand:- start:2061 stop:3449 length:1389 start_codon:yes stop_codon:yes gene_type:complete
MPFNSTDGSFPHEALAASKQAVRDAVGVDTNPETVTMIGAVLTAPLPMSNEDVRNFVGELPAPDDASAPSNNVIGRFFFKVRLLRNGAFSPHEYLTDPCEAATSTNTSFACIQDLLALHTTAMSVGGYNGPRPKIGDLVEVELQRYTQGRSFWYNTQTATFTSIKDGSVRSTSAQASTRCANLAATFENQAITTVPVDGSSAVPGQGGPGDFPPPEQRVGAWTANAPGIPTSLGKNQATFYTVADRKKGDIDYIILHSTDGSCCKPGKSLSTIRRFATGPTLAYRWTNPTTNAKITNPKCSDVLAAQGSLPQGTVCHPTAKEVHTPANTSIHYAVDQTGTVVQGVLEKDIANHVGRGRSNKRSIGIEMNGKPRQGPGEGFLGKYAKMYNDKQVIAVAQLVAQIAKRWDIPIDRQHIKGHYEFSPSSRFDPGNDAGQGNDPPGAYWNWDDFLARVRAANAASS